MLKRPVARARHRRLQVSTHLRIGVDDQDFGMKGAHRIEASVLTPRSEVEDRVAGQDRFLLAIGRDAEIAVAVERVLAGPVVGDLGPKLDLRGQPVLQTQGQA